MDHVESAIRLGEWLTIIAVLAGPILAVQAQKWIERGQARREMKDKVFRTLMATRAARISADHVQALNMITIAFYGSRWIGGKWQTKLEKEVCVAWREYFDNLNSPMTNLTDAQRDRLVEDRDDKFIVLLGKIATAQNFDFELVELKRSMYSPLHHSTMEAEGEAIRGGLAKVLSGQASFPMHVTNLPEAAPSRGHTESGSNAANVAA